MLRLKFIYLYFTCFLPIYISLPTTGFSQQEIFKIRQITTADGLLTPGVKFIYKDSEGFMWFAFSKGIARYDGYTIKPYTDFMPDSCVVNPYKYCTCFLEDSKGSFWIGTLKNGFARLNRATETFTYYMHPTKASYNSIKCFLEDKNGDLWLGSGNEGLIKFLPEEDTVLSFNPQTVFDHPGAEIVLSLLEDNSGNFWVGGGYGIFLFDREKELFSHVETEPSIPENQFEVKFIREDKLGDIWFGTTCGVFRYNPIAKSWDHYFTENPDKPNDFQGSYVSGMTELKAGHNHQMWISTATSIWVYDFSNDKFTFFKNQENGSDGLFIGGAKYLYLDDSDLLWASTDGITLIDPRENPFHYTNMFSYPDSLFGLNAWSLYEDKHGTLWVGTFSDGLYEYDSNLNFVNNYKPTLREAEKLHQHNKNRVSLIFEDSHGRLWVGSSAYGISIFDRVNKTFNAIYFKTPAGKKENVWVSEIFEDSYGELWFSTVIGLYKLDYKLQEGTSPFPINHPILREASISDLIEDSLGRIWVTTANRGIFCLLAHDANMLDIKRYFHVSYNEGLFSNRNAAKIFGDFEGNIWFMSEKYLFKYDESSDSIQKHKHFNKVFDGENRVFTGDSNGNLWFITESGLMKYNPADTSKMSLKQYGNSEGMYYSELVFSSFAKSKDGSFFIGGSGARGSGFCRFHPDSIYDANTNPPGIVLTDFKIKNEPVELDSSITYKKHISLQHNQNFFSFEFAAIEYRDPSKNHHAYMLEGLDEDWIYSGTRRFANYTGVPPGDYVFKVKGSNNNGYWNEEGTSIHVSIAPPPWGTWWAYSLYALFLVAFIVGWRSYDLKRQHLKQALQIEHVESAKLKELDKMKSRFFANISHEFRTPLTLILGPLEKLKIKTNDKDCDQDLNVMQRNALRLQKLINQLLNLSKLESEQMKLRTSKENLVALLKGYVHSFESLAKQKNIGLKIISCNDDIQAYLDRDKLEKILYNLLSNAFKFTDEGGEIVVEVSSSQSAVLRLQSRIDGSLSDGDSTITDDWRLKTEDFDGKWVSISISDTGRGISPEKLPHIFDRFYQADDSYTKDQEGTGIGLALTRELVSLHYGKIEVKSTLGVGTVFTFYLPRGDSHLKPDEIVEPSPAKEISAEPEIGSATIAQEFIAPLKQTKAAIADDDLIDFTEETRPVLLVVEDNDDLRAYIRSYLDTDYVISEAFDGEIGLKKAIAKIPDLIVSDVMMPKMDGIQLCQKLKTDERTSHIPVVLLTAKAAMEDKLEGLETGADDFITKPFDPQELLVRIRNLIHQREKLRDHYIKAIDSEISIENAEPSLDQQFLLKIKKVLNKKIEHANFGVEEFAADMALSRVQLHRKLKALINTSATDLIRSTRLKQAAELLKAKTGTVTEIAYQVGFNNLSYFAKCFQEKFGVNPSEYA